MRNETVMRNETRRDDASPATRRSPRPARRAPRGRRDPDRIYAHETPRHVDHPSDLPRDCLLTVARRWPGGRRACHAVTGTPDGAVLHTWIDPGAAGGTAGWQRSCRSVPGADLPEVVAKLRPLREVPPGAISRYTVESEEMTEDDLVLVLRTPWAGGAAEGDGWPGSVGGRWRADGATFRAAGLPHIARWASVNGQRITALRAGTDAAPRLALVALEWDTSDRLILRPLRTVAHHSWAAGVSSLDLIGAGLALRRDTAGPRRAAALLPYPTARADAAALIADWVTDGPHEVAAALTLEQLDPRATLPAGERAAWSHRVDRATGDFFVLVDDDVRRALRRRLARQSAVYRRVRRALLAPAGPDGQALAAALDAAPAGIPPAAG